VAWPLRPGSGGIHDDRAEKRLAEKIEGK